MRRECPLAISMFCPEVDPEDANVMTCLQTVSARPDFPEGCRCAGRWWVRIAGLAR